MPMEVCTEIKSEEHWSLFEQMSKNEYNFYIDSHYATNASTF